MIAWLRLSLRRLRDARAAALTLALFVLATAFVTAAAPRGGAAADPDGILYVNSNEMGWIQTMKATTISKPAEKAYQINCSSCHGIDKKGNPLSGYPSLQDISSKKSRTYIQQIISNGKGMMPGFNQLSSSDKAQILSYLLNELPKETNSNANTGYQTPFQMTGYNKFLDSEGMAGISPPWGTLNAIDLTPGRSLQEISPSSNV